MKHTNEGLGRILQTACDIFNVVDLALLQPLYCPGTVALSTMQMLMALACEHLRVNLRAVSYTPDKGLPKGQNDADWLDQKEWQL